MAGEGNLYTLNNLVGNEVKEMFNVSDEKGMNISTVRNRMWVRK